MQAKDNNTQMILNGNTSYNQELRLTSSPSSALRRLSLLTNQLSENRTSSKYESVPTLVNPMANPSPEYKVQNIVPNEDGSINIGKDLVGYPIVIPYKDDEPVLQTEQQKIDYQLLKELFLNADVMKTSSFNNGKPLNEEQLESYIKKVTRKEKNVDSQYGLYRIYDKKIGKDVGVQGMIDIGLKSGVFNEKVVESLTFLKSEYLKQGYGRILIDSFFRHFKGLNDRIVYTVKGDNPATSKICTENLAINLDVVRNSDGSKGWTNVFTIDYELAKNRPFVLNEIVPRITNKFHTEKLAESNTKENSIGNSKL